MNFGTKTTWTSLMISGNFDRSNSHPIIQRRHASEMKLERLLKLRMMGIVDLVVKGILATPPGIRL